MIYSKPSKPLLVLYTMFDDRWSFLHFEVDETVFINPGSCTCRNCQGPNKTCKKAVIESTKGKLKIKRYSASSRDGLNNWDLAVLRKPSHPHANTLATFHVKYAVLTFATMDDKLEFQTTLGQVQQLLQREKRDYDRATQGA